MKFGDPASTAVLLRKRAEQPSLVVPCRLGPGDLVPCDQQVVRVSELPDQPAATVSDRLAGAELAELGQPPPQDVRLAADVDRLRRSSGVRQLSSSRIERPPGPLPSSPPSSSSATVSPTGADESLIEHVTNRPGHDRCYSLSRDKVQALGWEARVRFAEGLEQTVAWYRENAWWWSAIRSGEYRRTTSASTAGHWAPEPAAACVQRQRSISASDGCACRVP